MASRNILAEEKKMLFLISSFITFHPSIEFKKGKTNDYVFPGTGAAGHIIEPRKQMANVTKVSGVAFTVHDLRRTFITIA